MLIVDPLTYDIAISRGSREAVRYTITDALTGAAKDLTGWSFKFTVKGDIDDDIASAIFQKTNPLANGIDVALAASGIIDVHFATADTASLGDVYVCDLEGTEPTKDPQTLIWPARFLVRKDVSTPGTAPSPTGVVIDFPDGISATVLYLKDTATGRWIKLTNSGGFPLWGADDAGPPPY